VKDIIRPIQDTDLTTVRGRIMEEVQSWSQLAIDRIIVVPDTGMAARITSGNPATGHGGTGSECGSVVITSCEGTKPVPVAVAAASAGYQAVTRPPSKPRKVPTSVSRKSWRLR
jgi:hypothetical protein